MDKETVLERGNKYVYSTVDKGALILLCKTDE